MADEKKLTPPQWLGRPIVHDEHVNDLETRAAINEFHHKMPRAQAEQVAHESYVKEQRERAAAHHLAGMKAAMATGNHEDARKHWALYDLHLKALGKDSIGAVPPEIEKRMIEDGGQKPVYKFKAHKGDLYALHEPSHDQAPAQGQPIQKAEEDLDKSEKLVHSPEDAQRLAQINQEYNKHQGVAKWGKTPHERDTARSHMNRLRAEKLAIHAKTRAAARAAGTSEPVQKAEAKQCKWRLGERRCQRMVSGDYCHDHVDHWANKIKQKEAAAEPTEKAELGHIQKPCPLCNEKQKNLSHHLNTVHEFEMEQRRKNPDDPVVAGLKKEELLTKPPVSEAQRRAMEAAAHGHSTLGIPKSVGKEFADADPGGKLPKHKKTAKAEAHELALQLLKGLQSLFKGSVIQFPGNPAPAQDLGAKAPVIGTVAYGGSMLHTQQADLFPGSAPAAKKKSKLPRRPVQPVPHGIKNHNDVVKHVASILGGECAARSLDDGDDYEATQNALAAHFGVHPDVIHEELRHHTSRAMDDGEDRDAVTDDMADHLSRHFGFKK